MDIKKIIFGIILFIFSIAIMVKIWYWIPIITSIYTDEVPLMIFWVGLVLLAVTIVFVLPILLIVQGFENREGDEPEQ